MSDTETDADYETVTANRAEIRRVVDRWDGRPAIAPADTPDGPVAVVFDDAPDGVQPVQWDAFFDRLEEAALALAFDSGEGDDRPADHAFVDRSSGDGGDAEPDGPRDPSDHPVDAFDDDAVDQPASFRERRAEAHENIDNHRDEEPFQS